MNKKAIYNLTYGLFVLTARCGEKDNGEENRRQDHNEEDDENIL